MDFRLVCVTDSNIWIDLAAGGLFDAAFRLPVDWLAPDVVIDELIEPSGSELVQRGLKSRELSGAQVLEVLQLALRYPQPSRVDLFALVLAQALGAVLLTGDRHLRRVAEHEGVTVHGILWLLDELINQQLIEPRLAAKSLEYLVQRGSRLPMDEVQRRLSVWWR